MNISIHALTLARQADFFRFFDDVAFADHPEWSWCYCTFFHSNDTVDNAEFPITCREDARRQAQGLIDSGTMQGYLAYSDDGGVVGWCNAGDKSSYRRLTANEALWPDREGERVLSVVCFTIAPDARRQGVAKSLLQHVCEDASARGYTAVEAYPISGEHDCFDHFHGYPALYEACGFVPHRTLEDGYSIVRKVL